MATEVVRAMWAWGGAWGSVTVYMYWTILVLVGVGLGRRAVRGVDTA